MLTIPFVIRRPFLSAATTAIFFGFYAVVFAAANSFFSGSRLASSPLFNFGFFLVALPLFELVLRRLQTPLDRLFFRDKLDYQQPLLEITQPITPDLTLHPIPSHPTPTPTP